MKFQKFSSYMLEKFVLSIIYFIIIMYFLRITGYLSEDDIFSKDPTVTVLAYVFFAIAYFAYCICH